MLNLDVVGGMPDTLQTETTVTIIVGGAVMGATVAAVLQSHTVVCASNSKKAKYKPKPPAKSRKLGRKRKQSTYDLNSAKAILGLPTSARQQEVISAMSSAPGDPFMNLDPASPTKEQLKARIDLIESDNKKLITTGNKLRTMDKWHRSKHDRNERTIERLKDAYVNFRISLLKRNKLQQQL